MVLGEVFHPRSKLAGYSTEIIYLQEDSFQRLIHEKVRLIPSYCHRIRKKTSYGESFDNSFPAIVKQQLEKEDFELQEAFPKAPCASTNRGFFAIQLRPSVL